MPKRAHGRPAKARSRPRRPTPQSPASRPAATPVLEPDGFDGGAVTTATPASPAASPAALPTQQRRPASRRAAPAVAINYHYLNRDIRTLGVLAPSMVVILVIAFLFLH